MKYLSTPADHLPAGFPLPLMEDHIKYGPIWGRAFDIHKDMHDFSLHTHSAWSLSVMQGSSNYCDCYEIAYQQLKHIL